MQLLTVTVFCLLVVGAFCNQTKKPKQPRLKNATSGIKGGTGATTYPRCLQVAYKNYFGSFSQNFTQAGEVEQAKTRRSRDIRTPTNDTAADCPTKPSFGLKDPTKQRALCPWKTVNDHDPMRYPEDIIVAECRCTNGCLGFPSGVCERVYYNVPALRLLKENTCRFKREWYPVAIGCTCSFPPRKG